MIHLFLTTPKKSRTHHRNDEVVEGWSSSLSFCHSKFSSLSSSFLSLPFPLSSSILSFSTPFSCHFCLHFLTSFSFLDILFSFCVIFLFFNFVVVFVLFFESFVEFAVVCRRQFKETKMMTSLLLLLPSSSSSSSFQSHFSSTIDTNTYSFL